VIKYLHHSVNTKGTENQLTQMGHKVRNVIDGSHRVTKKPLNLLVDLEQAGNKEIYTINWLQNKAVAIERPKKEERFIAIPSMSQQYRPFVRIKCGGSHASCKQPNNTPAT
jgi:hypothetical protein